MHMLCIAVIVLLYCQYSSELEQTCSRGHKLQTTATGLDVCVQCENGINFMSDEGHKNRKCNDCTQIENLELEILVSGCNITHDAEVLCQRGYYRYKARSIREKDRCEKCRDCKNSLRVCRGYHDTICCPSDHDAVMMGSDVFVCQRRPIQCGPGQYFSAADKECLPCPDGTYMFAYNHTHTGCLKCASLSGNLTYHSVIVQKCNATSPTVFGCEDGYFRNVLHDSLIADPKCTPCQKCLREARKCDMYHNTICFYDDHVLGQTGDLLEPVPSVTQRVTVCEDGHFLYINISNGSRSCKPCDDVTFTEETALTITANQTEIPYALVCQRKTHKYGEFRVYSILLFVLAILVDILYVFIYSRTFLRKNFSQFPRRDSLMTEKLSSMIGTVGINLHFVCIFMHLFGTLCEVGVVNMAEDTLWTFTIAVGVTSIIVYFADAVLFLFVKRLVSLKGCISRSDQNTRHNRNSSYDDAHAFIDSTDI